MNFLENNDTETTWLDSGFSYAVGSRRDRGSFNCSRIMADGSSCFGQLSSDGNRCEPCDSKSNMSDTRSRGRYYNQSGTSSYQTCASTMGNCPCSYGGCMDSFATNYDNKATCDDGSCQYAPPPPLPQFGCTTVGSLNYDPNANTDDGSCISPVSGCTDPNATNYNPNANTGCSSNFSGYSNFNQQGFGGYEDRLWFN